MQILKKCFGHYIAFRPETRLFPLSVLKMRSAVYLECGSRSQGEDDKRTQQDRSMKVRLGYFGRCVLRALPYEANLPRCVRPERATNIVLSALVDVSCALYASTRNYAGVSDRSAQDHC
jgi:hypothetical protein